MSKKQKWACTYMLEGTAYATHTYADTREEAEAHLKASGDGWVEGPIVFEQYIPVPESTPTRILHMIGGILVRIVARVKG